MKTFIIAFTIGLLATLTAVVINGTNTPECEALYNEYSATVDMPTRDALFAQGMENGCFHNE